MWFQWDPKKGVSNLKKHRVSFEAAQTIFEDPFHLSILDERQAQEERWITIGKSLDGQILVAAHIYWLDKKGDEIIRLISARKASRREKRQYEKGI